MSYFPDGVVYIIVPIADVTNEMINNVKMSFNTTLSTMRQTLPAAPIQKKVLKLKEPVSSVFNNYKWYNRAGMLAYLSDPENGFYEEEA